MLRICLLCTSHLQPYRTIVQYFSSIFDVYRTQTIPKKAYRTSVPYFLAKIETYRTAICFQVLATLTDFEITGL